MPSITQKSKISFLVQRAISSVHNGFELWTLDFFVLSSFFAMYGAGFYSCSFVLCGFSNILDDYTFSGICLVITSAFGYLNIPDKFVMDHNPLTAVFTNAFGFINRYLIYEFSKKRCSQFLHFHKSSDSTNIRLCVFEHNSWYIYHYLYGYQKLHLKKNA